MAETAKDDATRGRPYYEKVRKDLKETIKKKRALDDRMIRIEEDIAQLETKYLEDTSAAGNIIRGFDNYIKASGTASTSASAGGGTATRRKGGISDADRIFSRSSVSWSQEPPSLITSQNGSNNASNAPTPTGAPGSARDTPASGAGGGQKAPGKNTKKKGVEKDDDEERPSKRGKMSWGRE